MDKSCGSVDRSIEQKPPRTKRGRNPGLTLETIQAVPLPLDLQAVEGYAEAFTDFARMRQKKPAKVRWSEEKQVVGFHATLARFHGEGYDVVLGLQDAYQSNWQGITRRVLGKRDRPHLQVVPKPSSPPLTLAEKREAYLTQMRSQMSREASNG